jgi:hypothetical protein
MSKLKQPALLLAFVSILIIALFVFVPTYPGPSPPSPVARTRNQLAVYRVASMVFFETANRWPTSATELVTNSMGIAFISRLVPDGWGRQIICEPHTTNNGYGKFVSYGRDGKPGGMGADADMEQRFP